MSGYVGSVDELLLRRAIELISEWEKAISEGDKEKARDIAFKILKGGEEVMKSSWNDVRPGERLSEFAGRMLGSSVENSGENSGESSGRN